MSYRELYDKYIDWMQVPKYMFSPSEGWLKLFSEFLEAVKLLEKQYEFTFSIIQVKQKLGRLEIYYIIHPRDSKVAEEIHLLVREAKLLAACTCEVCGAPGVLRSADCLEVLCDVHAEGDAPFVEPPLEVEVDGE